MTPEELEELRALVVRLSGTAYNENLAAILGAALEHIHKQDARIVELETQIDLLQNEIFELRKGTDSQKVISELMAQVAALQEIAEEERAKYNLSWKDCTHRAPDTYCEKTHNYCTLEDCPLLEEQKTDARRQLAKEHLEVDWK